MGLAAKTIPWLHIGTSLSGLKVNCQSSIMANDFSLEQAPWGQLNGINISGYPRTILPDLDEPMTNLYAKTGMVGHSCARVYKGRLIFTRAYGWAYKGKPEETVPTPQWIPMSTIRSNPIGSCSKSITAVAILRLIEDRRISLDTKVIEYLEVEPILEPPEFAHFDRRWKDIRIRHLLSHTAGVPDWGKQLIPNSLLNEMVKTDKIKLVNGDQVSRLDAIRFWMRMPLQFEPGRQYKYAGGYELLAAVIEKASGMRCDRFVEKAVFQPLSLTSETTWCYAGTRAKYEQYSREHRFFGYGFNRDKNAYE